MIIESNVWSARWLTKGGKEILIKAIELALPTYIMSSFMLPLEICEKLASAVARFWWSSNPPKWGMRGKTFVVQKMKAALDSD